MTFGQFLAILRARKLLGLSVFFGIIAITVLLSLVLPKKYTATASVVVDVKPDPIALMANQAMIMPSFMATQVDIMTSDRVALRVIRDLRLLDNPQIQEQWRDEGQGKGSIEQWLIEILQKQLDVKPSRESNVIQLIYKAPEPRFAAALANAFAQAYVATTLELRVDPAKQFTGFFDVQTKEARAALEKAQGRLSTFQREKGIIVSDERFDIENMQLNDLSAQLVQIQGQAAESGSRKVQAQGASGDRIQDVLNNPLISAMKAELTRSEARLQELNSKYGENHPQVVEARASIADSRAKLEIETRRVAGGVGVSNTINEQREAQVRKQLSDQRLQVMRMRAAREEGGVLSRDVENAQRVYDGMVARLNQTALESQSTQSYASVLTTAQPPTEHSSPKLLLNTLLSIFVGIIASIGLIFGRELTDRRIRAPEDLVIVLGIPVLGSLPTTGVSYYKSGKRIKSMQQRVLGLSAPKRTA